MNKFTRFTLFAGMLAIGLTACGDDVEVVEPTPPPPPPVEAQLQPASITLELGQSTNLSVNITGGVAGEEASWECSSSNTSIATVTESDTGCLVQASATNHGDASINAQVTKSGETVNAGATVVVLEDTSVPATVVIEKVTQGNLDTPVNLNSVRRQIEVTVNVDPGTELVQEVRLLFRGDVVASQTLTPAQAAELIAAAQAGEDDAEAQVLRTITFSWETDSYQIDAGANGVVDGTDVVTVDHLNGQGNLVAELAVADAGGEGDAIRSDAEQITLRNRNGFHLKIERTGSLNSALDVVGLNWRGGRDAGGAQTDAGLDAHLLPVIYTPNSATPTPDDALGLQAAQFVFGVGDGTTPRPGGWTVVVDSDDPAWTWTWSPSTLSNYSMPVATPAFPNQARDGEYPRLSGEATLSDGQGMGPYGGALDCTGGFVTPGAAIGILNIEFTEEQILCPGGQGWSPPSATIVADDETILDPLRSGERIDNYAPEGAEFSLASRPGLPNWPQIPSSPDTGGLVPTSGVWINDMVDFSHSGILDLSGLTDGLDTYGTATGVSRAVAGFPAPTFLDPLFFAANGDEEEITDDPTTGNPFFTETASFDVYTASAVARDKLDNRREQSLTGDGGSIVFGIDATNPTLMHTGASTQNRMAYDLVTPGADDPTIDNYFVSWTDPITTAASGFSAFGGNPVWRHVHRVTPGGVTNLLGTSSFVTPLWSPTSGTFNYSRELASQQPVTDNETGFGYYIYRSYALDDAGNVTHDGTAAVDEPELEVPTYLSPLVRRQAAIAPEQPTVLGVTAPPVITGGSTETFVSNASHQFDLGLGWFSLDYPAFANDDYWTVAAAPLTNTVGGYYSPVTQASPVQGTTGGVRFQGADWIIGWPDSKIFDDTDFETVETLVPTSALSQDVPGVVRSIEWVCAIAGGPPGCPAAPADWADVEANLQENAIGGGTSAGWFIDEGVDADANYEANRVLTASFTAFDATRWDPRTDMWSGTTNAVLEQIGADDATSPFPNRYVSTAPINPISVPLNEVGGTITAVYTDDVIGADTGDHTAWAIQSASGTITGSFDRTANLTVTARLVGASTIKAGGPGQNIFERIDFFVLEPGTGTLRFGGSQMNPVLTENEPGCVADGSGTQDQYRCWDFTSSFSIQNLVNAPSGTTVYVVAVGVNASGDGLATFPVEITLP